MAFHNFCTWQCTFIRSNQSSLSPLCRNPPDNPVPQWLERCVVAQKQTIASYWSSQKLLLSHWLARTWIGRCALGQVWQYKTFQSRNPKQKCASQPGGHTCSECKDTCTFVGYSLSVIEKCKKKHTLQQISTLKKIVNKYWG